jgi:hypothetical protein
LASPDARATSAAEQCLAAYDDYQKLRDEGDLVGAKGELPQCATTSCPVALQRECTESLKELTPRIPTIIPTAHDPQKHDIVDVSVTVDGKPLKNKLDGREVEINPGPHHLRFTSAGRKPVERDVLVREREKGRVIEVELASTSQAVETTAQPQLPQSAEPSTTNKRGGTPVLFYVLGGIGVAALGTASFFGISGLSARSDADKCKPNCTQHDVDVVNQRFLGADISLGIGVLALAAATWIYLSQGKAPDTSVSSR